MNSDEGNAGNEPSDSENSEPAAEAIVLTGESRRIISELIRLLRELAGHATSANDLVGIGEVWAALEEIETAAPSIIVGVSVSLRGGTSDYHETNYRSIRVSEEGIELEKLFSVYSREIGSDHESARMSRLGRDGKFAGNAREWMEETLGLMQHAGWRLSVSRDHA